MEKTERQRRIAAALAEEALNGKFGWWWISFADGDLPKGQQFLGVAIVQGFGFGSATMAAHRLGINPGGEAQGLPFPEWTGEPPAEYQNRLLQRDELAKLELIIASRKRA